MHGRADSLATSSVLVVNHFRPAHWPLLQLQVRHDPRMIQNPPVSLHVNYHANKLERLLAAGKHWVMGDKTDLMAMEIKSHKL